MHTHSPVLGTQFHEWLRKIRLRDQHTYKHIPTDAHALTHTTLSYTCTQSYKHEHSHIYTTHTTHTQARVHTHTQARAYKTQTYHENYIFLQGHVIFSIYREVSLGPLEIQCILQINYVTYTKSQIKRTFKNINQKTRWVNFVNYLFIVFNNKTIIQWNESDNRMKKKPVFSIEDLIEKTGFLDVRGTEDRVNLEHSHKLETQGTSKRVKTNRI